MRLAAQLSVLTLFVVVAGCAGGASRPLAPNLRPSARAAGLSGTIPTATASHYVCGSISQDAQVAYEALGYAQGMRGENGIVILDFGQPWKNGQKYGSYLPFHCGFVSTTDIYNLSAAFVQGFVSSQSAGGSGMLTLAVGTNNYSAKSGQVTPGHARAWAAVINQLEQTFAGTAGVSIVAASDMQLDWNTAATTRAWVDAYAKVAVEQLFNYGNAAGCPQHGKALTNGKALVNGTCDNGWTQDDVWYVSGGAPIADALPQIFTTNGSMAREWYELSLYGYNKTMAPLTFLGALTERGECGCGNTPAQAYSQLFTLLNNNKHTVQSLAYASDITKDSSFYYTGAEQTYTVPNGTTSLEIDVLGADSGSGSGGLEEATLPVTPGEFLAVFVGGLPGSGGLGGYNGGGGGGQITGIRKANVAPGGGGASDVRQGGDSLDNRVVVAGAAGGASSNPGGDGGGLIGGSCPYFNCGAGGTQYTGGLGGVGGSYGTCVGSTGATGSLGSGGGGGDVNCGAFIPGGGGGGGYYGGGGGGGGFNSQSGTGGGGGGGSSYAAPQATNVVNVQAYHAGGAGKVLIYPGI